VEVESDGINLRNIHIWQPNPDGTGQGGFVAYDFRVLRPLTAYLSKNTEGRCLTIFFTVTPVEEEECIGWMWMAMNHSYETPEAEQRAFQDRIVAADIPLLSLSEIISKKKAKLSIREKRLKLIHDMN